MAAGETIMLRNSLCLALLLCGTRIMLGQVPAPGTVASSIPTVIRVSGSVRYLDGKELSGSRSLTFALYQNQEGGISIWTETQTLALDSHGRYTVFLGSVSPGGVPPELFSSGGTQWIGVTPDDGIERPRFAITTVPYAFEAADADTLGGKKPEEFVSVQQLTTLLGNGIGDMSEPSSDVPAATASGNEADVSADLLRKSPANALGMSRTTMPWGGVVGAELVSNGISRPPVYQVKAVSDVRDYGVTCGGTIDDTVAMQSALA